jgi:hypothetical protein
MPRNEPIGKMDTSRRTPPQTTEGSILTRRASEGCREELAARSVPLACSSGWYIPHPQLSERARASRAVPGGVQSLPVPVLPANGDMARVHTDHIPIQEREVSIIGPRSPVRSEPIRKIGGLHLPYDARTCCADVGADVGGVPDDTVKCPVRSVILKEVSNTPANERSSPNQPSAWDSSRGGFYHASQTI